MIKTSLRVKCHTKTMKQARQDTNGSEKQNISCIPPLQSMKPVSELDGAMT